MPFQPNTCRQSHTTDNSLLNRTQILANKLEFLHFSNFLNLSNVYFTFWILHWADYQPIHCFLVNITKLDFASVCSLSREMIPWYVSSSSSLGKITCVPIRCVTLVTWGGATGRSLDLQSTGRGFKSYSGQQLRNNIRQVVHTYLPLSPSSISCYRPRGGDVLRLGR